jgi:hypothetical protein
MKGRTYDVRRLLLFYGLCVDFVLSLCRLERDAPGRGPQMIPLIPIINNVADQPDATARVKALIKALRTHLPEVTFMQDAVFEELDEKAAFIASAIVSGGHVHEMSMVFEGKAGSL